METPRRILSCLCAAQAACLAVGLWAHHQLLEALRPAPVAEVIATGGSNGPSNIADHILVYPLSFIWIAGLQGIAAWLLLHRMYGNQTKREQKSQEETLLTTKELIHTRDAIIFGLAKLAESRDADTGHHLERIALYATRMAAALRRYPKYRSVISPNFVRMIGISSALHDIGKVGVSDSILLKPGKLTDVERFRMQVHTTLGGDCIRQIEQRLGNSHFLQMARDIVLFHHERWDGEGYPHGLKGEDIPLSARIVSIADVYDAMVVKRVYKDAYPHERCVEEIRRGAGKQFDPELVEVFLSIESQFREIAQNFSQSSMRASFGDAFGAAVEIGTYVRGEDAASGSHEAGAPPDNRSASPADNAGLVASEEQTSAAC